MTGFVYFLRCGDFLKIGYSANPKWRRHVLQTGNPYDLELIGSHRGTKEQEQCLHKIFAHLEHRDEWFRCAEAILDIARDGLPEASNLPLGSNSRISKLERYLKDHGLSQSEFAKRIGVSQKAINYWVLGKRVPRLAQMIRIHEVTRGMIRAGDFYSNAGPIP